MVQLSPVCQVQCFVPDEVVHGGLQDNQQRNERDGLVGQGVSKLTKLSLPYLVDIIWTVFYFFKTTFNWIYNVEKQTESFHQLKHPKGFPIRSVIHFRPHNYKVINVQFIYEI